MPLTLTLTVVVTFSFLVSRLLQRYAPRRRSSGTAYILLGVLVGPEVAGLLDPRDLEQLQPFVSLTLGVIGFVLGLPLVRQLESVAVLEAGFACTGLIVAGASLVAWGGFSVFGMGDPQPWLPALTLGAAAAATSLPALRSAAVRFGASGPITRLGGALALIGNVVAVLTSGLALALASPLDADGGVPARLGLSEGFWLITSLAMGVVCGLLFHFFVRAEKSEERMFLGTVGIIVFTSGMASGMGVSALVLNLVAGVTVAVAAGRGRDHSRGLARLERPAFIVLMIFAGAMWRPAGWASVAIPAVFYVLRQGVLLVAAAVALTLVPRIQRIPRMGHGLAPLGGVAVAIAVNYAQVGLTGSQAVLAGVLGAVALSELLALPGLRRLWIDAGEVSELVSAPKGSRS